MTKAEVAALEKKMEEKLHGVTSDMEILKNQMSEMNKKTAAQHDEMMKILQSLQKDQESIKNPKKSNTEKPEVVAIPDDIKTEAKHGWTKRVELPTFDGDDPLGWLTKAENFFEIQQIDEDKERMRLALICMEGEASHWYKYWRRETATEANWGKLSEALLERFGDCAQGTVHERLKTIKQRNSVGEYIREFELLAQTQDTPEHIILGCFIGGLRKSIRDHVRVHDPKHLVKALAIARRVEETQHDTKNSGSSFNRHGGARYRGNGIVPRTGSRDDPITGRRPENNNTRSTNASTSSTANEGKSPMPKGQFRATGTCFLSNAEHARRRRENLCFGCGGPYAPGHRCKESGLRIIILGADEEVDDEGEIKRIEDDPESGSSSDDEELNEIELSHISTKGLSINKASNTGNKGNTVTDSNNNCVTVNKYT